MSSKSKSINKNRRSFKAGSNKDKSIFVLLAFDYTEFCSVNDDT